MKKVVILVAALSFVAISCKTTSHTVRKFDTEVRESLTVPKIADYSVDLSKKITAQVTKPSRNGLENTKKVALAMAIEESGADLIFDPVYTVTKSFMTISVSVSGFYAKYTEVREVTNKDIDMLREMDTLQMNKTVKASPLKFKKKK